MNEPINQIHPTAIIGHGTKIWHFAVVHEHAVIAENCSIGSCAEVGRGTQIGAGTRIGFGSFTPPNMVIGIGVFIGPNVTFCDDLLPVAGNTKYHAAPPTVEDCASIGAGCIIMPGVVIGAGAMVGAGCLVTKNVKPFTVIHNQIQRVERHA